MEEQLFLAESDVKDFFYRPGIEDGLSDYFAMELLSTVLLREYMSSKERVEYAYVLDRSETGSPCLTVPPMGFSWSFYLAREAHRFLAQSAMPSTFLAQDSRPVQDIARPGGVAVIYADNATQIGDSKLGVDDLRHLQLRSPLEEVGLAVHEEQEAGLIREPLGVRVDGQAGVVRPMAKRMLRLTQALRCVRTGRQMSGRDIEQLVGHITFVLLLCRLSPSLLDHVYVYIWPLKLDQGSLAPPSQGMSPPGKHQLFSLLEVGQFPFLG